MVNNLSNSNSVLNQFMSEIRDKRIQKDSLRFRRNIERIGEIMAYEISKTFSYKSEEVKTPLGISHIPLAGAQPVVVSVLRAGLPLHTGVLNYFDRAENGFISAYRKHHDDSDTFDIRIEYLACPDLTGKTVILCDPMLASGSSMVLAYEALLQRGKPAHTHLVSIVASVKGVEYVSKQIPNNTSIWCAAIDNELNAHAYIVPGLGDAGDLAFGSKI